MDSDKIYIDIENSESKENTAPHHGKPISLVSVSPSGTYVVTYSSEDTSIEGWVVDEDVDDEVSKWIPLKPDPKVTAYTPDSRYAIEEIKVSDNKIVLYGNRHYLIEIINMSDKNNPFELKIDSSLSSLYKYVSPYYFNKNGDLIVNKRIHDLSQILVYSPKQNNKLISSYYIYKNVIDADNNGINNGNSGCIIDDNNNIWATSSNHLFQWKLKPLQLEFSYSLGFDRINEVKIGKDLIIVKYKKGIEIYSKGIHYPIRYIQTEYSITKVELLCDLYLLVIMEEEKEEKEEERKQHIRLYDLTDNDKHPVDAIKIFKDEESENKIFLCEYKAESKKAFGLVNEKISSMNLSNQSCHDFLKSNNVDVKEEVVIGWNETTGWEAYLNDNYYKNNVNDVGDYYDDDMKNIIKVFSTEKFDKEIDKDIDKDDKDDKDDKIINIDFKNKEYKWRMNQNQNKLLVYNINDELLDSKRLIYDTYTPIRKYSILNNDALVLLYHNHLVIYKYDINNKSIKIQYYYSNYRKELTAEEFSGSILPINIDKDDKNSEIFNEWIENFIEDNKYLAKYGQTLLSMLIKKMLTSHIESIFSKCIRLAKEDPKRNLKFLNIITLSMKGLYKEYPDYIARFNSEMFMLLDPFPENFPEKYHHFAFNKEIDVYKDIFKYTLKYLYSLDKILDKLFVYFIYFLLILFFPITIIAIVVFIVYTLVYKSDIIYDQLIHDVGSQYISLIVPYVDFSCYSFEYDWWRDLLFPQSSAFVDTCQKKEFYTNWNGEAIINFKWKKFGRYYFFGGWSMFSAFLICFTAASFPSNLIAQEVRIGLYQISIVLGLLHLIFELRQFIWNPIKYFFSIWNWFDFSAYLFATITSFHRIYYDNTPNWVLSFSCLLLDLKFLLFFRVFELFGIGKYLAIIFGVARHVIPFVLVLGIIIMSFAHAFFVLLHPENYIDSLSTSNSNSSDPNNPWKLTNTYIQVDENGNINSNNILIQQPDENTNLFYSYFTSILAMDRFLIGDQNSLSSRTPTNEHTPLIVLTFLFSFIVVIYLMNLFIGLLNMAITEENSRASFLSQKAEVLAEIELFYLLPFQRRWKTWFPEVIYYTVSHEKARIYVRKAIDNGDWKNNDCDYNILKLFHIEDAMKDYWA